ncbi:ABC transporter ATP-binding protein [Haloferax mediterranei ATCC 33500]|uniref:ABC-type D-xylose/L-arabinose transporter n=1 Tax=Haloferax mediterranei (strain ATCC 33500 / DSM 1411 / JCM 8866 / NBRC 14739 / NCIMB 2177 / R-4) TaxID=523841 RepID=I3R206_HALMT|nr:ABC transporter ATP-binding protein [Haloferax mediterranei]AFK18266.2 sugar ABC transporter ATP-binding protein [Haloferax mediterranei ATCC 33500]AHZ22332.1 sugar ABC transporter ATP-binding protein [Haloferax mediterranei ATCC 33500]EMA02461.1 sugar ABC transporter ATP-binding protein [Haloferax mediterranei ATCC 33500]MDX5988356.1 ABC transporter ATP-binding protein [Haloferax mediterranei ATCC 33500]QCQ74789.1 ABC transporter ATP-binding protein [Haloferax mediterranei ATCC 33500]
MATITLDTLRKEFDNGRIVAVDDLSVAVEDGEFITVVGPSGCGKSTTLRMVSGLESPTSGRILVGDEDVTDQHARTRDVAMVFQNYALYPHKTVMENMAFGLRMSTDLSKAERRERVRETAQMMGIEELLDDKPDELSGGQKQRVALGRAIVREPDVFLFDEPLSNLDAKLRTTMRTEIQRLQNDLGITSLYVTHDQEEAMTMGDRIVILKDGKLQQVGRPKDVYENPANEFVGGFVGSPSMNFLDVSVEREGNHVVLVNDDSSFSYRLSESFSADLRETTHETEVRIGIRPEDVTPASDGSNLIDSTVGVVEPIGSDNYLHLDIAPDFIARVDSDIEPETDETISITFDESDLHVFHPKTGESLKHRESKQRATPVQ